MPEWRVYRKGDIEAIKPSLRYFDALTFQGGTNIVLDAINDVRITGAAITMTDEGAPIACGAIIQLWRGVGEAYAWTTPSIENHRRYFCERAQDFVDSVSDDFDLKRLQCSVVCGHDASVKWLERLGFQPEGIMRSYGIGGEDCLRMARIRA